VIDAVLTRFQQCARQEGVEIAAYGFQPDHVQLVVGGTRASTGRFLARAKQSSGYWFSTTHGGRLWERDSECAPAQAG
jgi:REP element-mobilizing transposase RayT